ncbi:male accessory gland serine protease inhibitor [Drosophila santomea]|uniref:male accessory gland serine protease inhibitor n=1 Tax=Drosophila santomea TaxID=129105 RepID=UPI001954E282|nr:male accessory gland serine protease inhibitor [Drosophila santomea]XP_043862296.1 male accessory gland serine protease inhibitor [Drosophila santomea]
MLDMHCVAYQSSTGVLFKMKYIAFVAIAILLSLSRSRCWVDAKPEMCQQPSAMAGMAQDGAACLAYMPVWTYDASKNACTEFMFGGCGGNSNQFSNQRECEKACKD